MFGTNTIIHKKEKLAKAIMMLLQRYLNSIRAEENVATNVRHATMHAS